MSGLPASGKTTTAARLHARLGGVLIRQCDVYRRLGIDLPAWVQRTAGFTRDVDAYERVRDAAYVEMRREISAALERPERPVVVDAVHGEPSKRRALYEVCQAYARVPVVVWCRCDDPAELRRRFAARVASDAPEHEANDLSVHRHLLSQWTPPSAERLPDGTAVPVVVYDSTRDSWSGLEAAPDLVAILTAPSPGAGAAET